MSLAGEVLGRWAPMIRDLQLQTGTSGRFEVWLDGDLVFSKASLGLHARPGEVEELLGHKLGPALPWRDA